MAVSTPARPVDPLGELNSDAKCEARSPELDVFDEYTLKWSPGTAGERPTPLTIRFEAIPSCWRTVRWWGIVLMVMAAAGAGVKLIGSRRSSTRHYSQRIEPRMARGHVPSVEPRTRHHRPRPTVAHPARAKHSRHRTRRRVHDRAVLTRRRFVPSVPASPPPVESPAVPRAQPRLEPPPGPFSYLGK